MTPTVLLIDDNAVQAATRQTILKRAGYFVIAVLSPERALDQFEQIYADSADSARIMALSMHPYIMGVPHRLKYFRRVFEVIRQKSDVKFWSGAQIADWYRAAGPKAP